MLFSIIGAVSNAFRGGQLIWAGKEVSFKIPNAILFGLCAFFSTGDWRMVSAAAFMFFGASFGWGDYIGALLGVRKENLAEQKWIDWAINGLPPKAWGFAGLSIRGAAWGVILALPFMYFGHSWFMFPLLGASMGMCYLAASWVRKNADSAWRLGEWFYGAALWAAL